MLVGEALAHCNGILLSLRLSLNITLIAQVRVLVHKFSLQTSGYCHSQQFLSENQLEEEQGWYLNQGMYPKLLKGY